MKHKIQVYRSDRPLDDRAPLWYVICACGWQPNLKLDGRYGRTTWDAAFALGVAHQQNSSGRGEE